MAYIQYKQNATKQITKYDEGITYIKSAIEQYEESITELSQIKGFEETNDLNDQLTSKVDELNSLISNINATKNTISSRASTLQQQQDERIEREKRERAARERQRKRQLEESKRLKF